MRNFIKSKAKKVINLNSVIHFEIVEDLDCGESIVEFTTETKKFNCRFDTDYINDVIAELTEVIE